MVAEINDTVCPFCGAPYSHYAEDSPEYCTGSWGGGTNFYKCGTRFRWKRDESVQSWGCKEIVQQRDLTTQRR